TQQVKDQNRESQRRSRARRLELINDLKNQVQDYQRRGASASLEMQRLAQAVTHENQRLRSLLSERGVSQEEIQQYLSSSPAALLKTPDVLYSHEPASFRCEACGSASVFREALPAVTIEKRADSCASSPQTAPGAPGSMASSCTSPETTYNGSSTAADAAASNLPSVSPTDDMETSCDTAASILVDLHHHVDPQRARAALGCKGSSSCTVSNIKIFQLLDNFPE
ncbi:hypothetical protein BBK36DRAFT_1198421, partial [Trichoderma citrinoviride]